jgi:hypothetical protein
MRNMKFLFTIAMVVLIPTTSAIAQKTPSKIRLEAGSKDGALLLRVPNRPFPYALQFSKNGKSGFGSRVYIMKVDASSDGYQYIARTLSPGRYRLDSVWQQGLWSLCLEQGTFEVDVTAGRISFVGTFHVDQLLREIQQSASDAGRTTVFGSDYYLNRDVKSAPVVSGRENTDLVEARAFAQSVMGGAADITQLAQLNDTAFSTSGFGKALKICG